MKNLIVCFSLLATACAGQTADFTTNDQSYYGSPFNTTVVQAVRVELADGLLTLTDTRRGYIVGRYRVTVSERDGVLYCRAAGNDLEGRFYRSDVEVRVDTLLKVVEVWTDGQFSKRFGKPEPVSAMQ